MKIWIVRGTTGEYSDRGDWVVDAHRSEEAAQARVKQLTEKLQASGLSRMSYGDERDKAIAAFRDAPDGDSQFDYDYTGTRWFISSCELRMRAKAADR